MGLREIGLGFAQQAGDREPQQRRQILGPSRIGRIVQVLDYIWLDPVVLNYLQCFP